MITLALYVPRSRAGQFQVDSMFGELHMQKGVQLSISLGCVAGVLVNASKSLHRLKDEFPPQSSQRDSNSIPRPSNQNEPAQRWDAGEHPKPLALYPLKDRSACDRRLRSSSAIQQYVLMLRRDVTLGH